jgi:hypothetical protein
LCVHVTIELPDSIPVDVSNDNHAGNVSHHSVYNVIASELVNVTLDETSILTAQPLATVTFNTSHITGATSGSGIAFTA